MSGRPCRRRRQLEDRPRARRRGRQPARLCARAAELAAPPGRGRLSRRARGAARRGARTCRSRRGAPGGRDALHGGRRLPTRGGAARRARLRADWAARTKVVNDTFAVLRAGTERATGSRSSAAPESTASAWRRTAGTFASRRSERSRATGAEATTSVSPRLQGGAQLRRARRGDHARAGGARALRLRDTLRTGGGDPRGGDPGASRARAAPVVFAEAAHDEVAAGIVDQLADEVVALAGTAIGRLGSTARGRGSVRRRAAPGGEFARGRADPRGAARRPRPCDGLAADRRGRAPRARRVGRQGRRPGAGSVRALGGGRWLRCISGRRRASTRGTTSPRSTRSTWTSRTGSSWSSSGRPARGRRPRCACWPDSRRSTPAGSTSASATSPMSRRRTATWRWSSRTTRSTPT